MPSEERAELVVHSSGGWPVSDTIEFLQAINSAYTRLLTFETVIEEYESRYRRLQQYLRYREPEQFLPLPLEQYFLLNVSYLPDDGLEQFISPRDQLIIQRVQLASPGFWIFLGSLNPLEVLRQYLNDLHTRRQDREYREPHEHRRLELENLMLENQVIRERISMARELGATDAELTPLLNGLVYTPLQRLDAVAARGMITAGEPSSDVSEPPA